MTDRDDLLDCFGRFIVETLHDQPLNDLETMFRRQWKAPVLQDLQNELAQLSHEQQDVCRRTVRRVLTVAIHQFLFALQEECDTQGRVKVLVDGVNVAEISDGLQGEPYSPDGWYARFSEYGECENM